MRLEARDWVSCGDTHLQGCCRGASVGGTRSKEERRTRLREGVWSAAAWERVGCGFALSWGVHLLFLRNRQWAAGPFTLGT